MCSINLLDDDDDDDDDCVISAETVSRVCCVDTSSYGSGRGSVI